MDPRRQRWLDFQEDEGSDETGPVSHAPIQETRARQQRRRRTRERERTSLSAEERHSRKVEQQRLRRAAQREQTIADSNHISKAERQRQRRAALREQSSPLEIQSVAPTVVLQNRRVAQQERVARARLQDDNILADLSERVLDSIIVTPDEVLWMGKNQRYLQDPRLALVYYYCCGTDPASFVFGDEQLRGEQGESARARIAELLDDFPKSSDIADCQAAVGEVASESTAIWACAACGRIVLANKRENIFFSSLDDLSGVRLSESERETLLLETPEPVARMYRQLYFYGNDIYYLIPDLVRDVNKIPLCKKCRKDPRQNKFSVASGHDYGRIGQLPDLNEVEVSCISPARCFGLELSLSGKHSKGHAICFPTDGPFELSRVLPRVDDRCVPRVTFIGPRETWRIAKKKFSKLYAISGANVYRWLTVLGSMNNIFKEEGIQIEDSPERRILLQELELMIQDGVQISDSAEAGALADMPSTLTGQDVDGDAASENAGVVRDVIMSNLAVLPHVEQSDSAVVHEIIDALAGAVGADLASAFASCGMD
ncbi:hypothetical protein DVH05_020820 [Phytophthora capsici]|nr:hypothetical protein DVH05_020820 [Phytophthora capsici]